MVTLAIPGIRTFNSIQGLDWAAQLTNEPWGLHVAWEHGRRATATAFWTEIDRGEAVGVGGKYTDGFISARSAGGLLPPVEASATFSKPIYTVTLYERPPQPAAPLLHPLPWRLARAIGRCSRARPPVGSRRPCLPALHWV